MTDVYLKSVLKRLRTSAATADAVDGFQAFVTPEEARALLAHIRAQDAALARLRADLAIIEQGCNSPWMTGAAFKDRVADLFAAPAPLDLGGAP